MASSSITCYSSSWLHTQVGNLRSKTGGAPTILGNRKASRLLLHCSSEQKNDDTNSTNSSTSTDKENEEEEREAQKKAFATLKHFVELNNGFWSGTFTQYDALGNVMACIPTRIRANIYGRGEHISLYQTLSIKQAKSPTSVSGDEETSQWIDYNVEEIDAVIIDRIHKVGYFPEANAYCLSHYNARIPDVVLRTGLLGEDDDEKRDSFPGVKLPCRRPALVNENCMFSDDGKNRIRAFHVLNAQGLLDMIGVFHEHKDDDKMAESHEEDTLKRMDHVLGKWEGRAMTQRTGLYGSTIGIEKLALSLHQEDNGQVIQTITSSPENRKTTELVLHGEAFGDVIRFTEGLQTTLLPRKMFITSPVSVGNCVQKSHAFCFEFAWIYAPGRRRRLIRTYDTSGAVVSTTFSEETRVPS